jgi:hypothetical protein
VFDRILRSFSGIEITAVGNTMFDNVPSKNKSAENDFSFHIILVEDFALIHYVRCKVVFILKKDSNAAKS